MEEIIGEETETCLISLHLPGEIIVRKYEDLNADGDRDDGEPGLSGWEITVQGTDVTGKEISISAKTGSEGVTFPESRPGNYTVTETIQSGSTGASSGWAQRSSRRSPGAGGCFGL